MESCVSNRGPLRVRFANDEWASGILDAARSIADRPAFSETSFEDILSFFEAMMPSLVEVHLTENALGRKRGVKPV